MEIRRCFGLRRRADALAAERTGAAEQRQEESEMSSRRRTGRLKAGSGR